MHVILTALHEAVVIAPRLWHQHAAHAAAHVHETLAVGGVKVQTLTVDVQRTGGATVVLRRVDGCQLTTRYAHVLEGF